jgi:hypothetical protein
VLAQVPPSVLRDELVRKASGAMGVPEARLVTLLGQMVGHGLSSGGVGVGALHDAARSARPSAAAPQMRGPQNERKFLAMCVAAPDLGATMLARIDPDALLVEDVLRRTARFLVAHLPGALPEPPEDDPELTVVLEDLIARAAQGSQVSSDRFEHARLVLESARLKREISYLREHGGGGLAKLSTEYQDVRSELHRVQTRMERPV